MLIEKKDSASKFGSHTPGSSLNIDLSFDDKIKVGAFKRGSTSKVMNTTKASTIDSNESFSIKRRLHQESVFTRT